MSVCPGAPKRHPAISRIHLLLGAADAHAPPPMRRVNKTHSVLHFPVQLSNLKIRRRLFKD